MSRLLQSLRRSASAAADVPLQRPLQSPSDPSVRPSSDVAVRSSSRSRKEPERLAQETNPILVQQREAWQQLAVPSRNRGKATTYAENLKIIKDWGSLPTNADGTKHGVRQMMQEKWGGRVADDFAYRLLNKVDGADSDDDDPLGRKTRSDKGVPRVLTPRKQARMHELSDEWNDEWTDEQMAAKLNAEFGTTITPRGINYHCNWVLPDDWDLKANVRAVPFLKKEHRDARVTWAREALKPQPPGVVDAHVDEKWYYTVRTRRHAKVSQRGATGSTKKRAKALRVQHKGYVPKVMFLACTARQGKVCLERVAETKEAGPKAKKYAPGSEYEKDCKLNGERYVEMMTTKIFPTLCAKFPNATLIRVQQDGARCHTGKKKDGSERITQELNEAGAKCSPRIEVVTQPAQSPDFNINDLAFFRALACAVAKVRVGRVDFDKDRLVADVKKAWEDYDEEKLARMWEYHSYCLQAAIDYKGGNQYPRHRTKEQKARAREEAPEGPNKRRRVAVPVDLQRRI